MRLTRKKLRQLIKEEVSMVYKDQLNRWSVYHDYTDLWNTYYRRAHGKDGFDLVEYNEPANILLIKPKEGTFSKQTPVAMFGVKHARTGYGTVNHNINRKMFGVGPKTLSEAQYDQLKSSPVETLKEVNPLYLKNFGLEDPTIEYGSDDKMEKILLRRFPEVVWG